MESLNNGHIGGKDFVLCREVVLFQWLKIHYNHKFGAQKCVHCREAVPFSEGPLSEVPLYVYFLLSKIERALSAVDEVYDKRVFLHAADQ